MSDSNREWGENTDAAIHSRNVLSNVRKYKDIGPLDDGFQFTVASGRHWCCVGMNWSRCFVRSDQPVRLRD